MVALPRLLKTCLVLALNIYCVEGGTWVFYKIVLWGEKFILSKNSQFAWESEAVQSWKLYRLHKGWDESCGWNSCPKAMSASRIIEGRSVSGVGVGRGRVAPGWRCSAMTFVRSKALDLGSWRKVDKVQEEGRDGCDQDTRWTWALCGGSVLRKGGMASMYKGEVLADHVMVLVFLVPAGGQIIEARAQSTEDCLARWKRELRGMNHLDPNSSVENFFFS